MAVDPIPAGYPRVMPYLCCRGAADAIEFYKKAFGAELLSRAPGSSPKSTMHASVRIGDAVIFVADEMSMSTVKAPKSLGGTTSSVTLFVPDVDATFKNAVSAGAKSNMPVADQFWGDRYGQVIDPDGHLWEIATHKEDLTADEQQQRATKFMAEMAKQQK